MRAGSLQATVPILSDPIGVSKFVSERLALEYGEAFRK